MNVSNWADGHIEYRYLLAVVNESVAGFVHIYDYDVSKVTFLSVLMERPIHKLEVPKCPPPETFNHNRW